MADTLVLVDGTQTVVEDGPAGTLYRLAVRIDGSLTRASSDLLGPALSALYATTLVSLLADQSLGGLAIHVAEGTEADEEVTGLEVDLAREAYTAPVAALGLHCTVLYWQAAGAGAQREAILDALMGRLNTTAPVSGVAVREQVLVALQAHVEAALGYPIARNACRPVQDAAVVMLEGDQAAYHDTMGLTMYRLTVAFEVFRPAGTEDQLDATVQGILGAVRSAGHLGGLTIDIELGSTDPDVLRHEYTGPLVAARIECQVWFATPEDDPMTVAP
jgi:hypothetical protein